jgi:hypothetical protein
MTGIGALVRYWCVLLRYTPQEPRARMQRILVRCCVSPYRATRQSIGDVSRDQMAGRTLLKPFGALRGPPW